MVDEPAGGDLQPHERQLLDAAVAAHRAGRLDQARSGYERILTRVPGQIDCLHLLGVLAGQGGDQTRGLELLHQARRQAPDRLDILANLAEALRVAGRRAEALVLLDAASPTPLTLAVRCRLLNDLGRQNDLVAAARAWVRLAPEQAAGWIELAAGLLTLERPDEASVAAETAERHDPRASRAPQLAGEAFYRLGRIEQATAAFARAVALAPNDGALVYNHAIGLHQLGRLPDAIAGYRRAAVLDPRHAGIRHGLALALASLGDGEGAIVGYCEAIRLDPTDVPSYVGLGVALQKAKRFVEAGEAFERALAVAPDDPLALSNLIHLKQYACDWSGLPALEQRLLGTFEQAGRNLSPFTLLSLPSTRAQQLAAARRASDLIAARVSPLPRQPRAPLAGRRLRLGYLSADFHMHATACLMAELFETHDRGRFELFAYSYGPDDGSPMRRRLVQAFEHFVDLAALDHRAAALRIEADRIDVLIDLKGHTTDSRLSILAARPAPLQLTWLGYPGTSGAAFIDFVIADGFVLPPAHEPDYSERVLRLPGCYQPNDSQRVVSPDIPTRAACGLPAQGFVFCCFNNSFKFRLELFEVWLALLDEVPGSVLWLLDSNPTATANLQAFADRHGIDADRIVFAPRLSLPEHLARHRLADLFLDTVPYNAHTTASDALWMGLPVLTIAGESFAGRVAGSLLTALGLPELVADSLEDYRHRALRLALNSDALDTLRAQLRETRDRTGVFDGRVFAGRLERALLALTASNDAPQY